MFKKILVVALFVVVAGVLGVIGFVYKDRVGLGPSYYAVYLDTGDLYFGKLSRFPSMTLTDVWYLGRDGDQPSFIDFSRIVWGPTKTIKLNDDRVVWVSRLASDSQLLPYLKGEASVTNQALPSAQTSQQPSDLVTPPPTAPPVQTPPEE